MKIHLKVTTKKEESETEEEYQKKKRRLTSEETFDKIDAFHNKLIEIANGD